MLSSVDGRILGSRWRPKGVDTAGLFERLHDQLGGDAWIVGRVTGQEFSKREAYPDETDQSFPRETHLVRRDADAYGIVLDARGKIAWGRADIGGDPIVVLLTRGVSDAHLADLREDGVSYIFAGEQEIDLALALEALKLPTRCLCWEVKAHEQAAAIKVEPAFNKGCFVHPHSSKPDNDLARNESANNLYGFAA